MSPFSSKITLVFLQHVLFANGDKSMTNYDLGWEIFHPFSLGNMPELATALQPSLDTVPLGGTQPVRSEGWPKITKQRQKDESRQERLENFTVDLYFYDSDGKTRFFIGFAEESLWKKTPNSSCVMTPQCWCSMVWPQAGYDELCGSEFVA